jgi:uncharacterized RDD family membrane protein YckC
MPDIQSIAVSNRASFGSRLVSLVVDIGIVAFTLGLIAVLLFTLTDGRLRINETLINSPRCADIPLANTGVRLPPQFAVKSVQLCTHTFFGIAFDRNLVILGTVESGSGTDSRKMHGPADRNGRVVQATYLNAVTIPFLLLYLFFTELRFGGSFGKLLMELRVRSLGGQPLAFGQASWRVAARAAPLIAGFVMMLLPVTLGAAYFLAAVAVVLAGSIAILVNVFIATRKGELLWHDRVTGTEVVRVQREMPGRV